ncbi:hypothetical protein BDZ88DRAFT_437117 [Geranomyces variabilis]|nr:hypothetical protein BDZ88DRAFT_437117 [Geranomyces variabilis]
MSREDSASSNKRRDSNGHMLRLLLAGTMSQVKGGARAIGKRGLPIPLSVKDFMSAVCYALAWHPLYCLLATYHMDFLHGLGTENGEMPVVGKRPPAERVQKVDSATAHFQPRRPGLLAATPEQFLRRSPTATYADYQEACSSSDPELRRRLTRMANATIRSRVAEQSHRKLSSMQRWKPLALEKKAVRDDRLIDFQSAYEKNSNAHLVDGSHRKEALIRAAFGEWNSIAKRLRSRRRAELPEVEFDAALGASPPSLSVLHRTQLPATAPLCPSGRPSLCFGPSLIQAPRMVLLHPPWRQSLSLEDASFSSSVPCAAKVDKLWTSYLKHVERLARTGCPTLRQKGRYLGQLAEFCVIDAAEADITIMYGTQTYHEKYPALVPAIEKAFVDILKAFPISQTVVWGRRPFPPQRTRHGTVTACHVEHKGGSTNAAEADNKFLGTVAFLAPSFTTCAGKRHDFSDTVEGSGRSDLVVSVNGGNFRNCATLVVVEFAALADTSANAAGAHTAFCVAAAEAVIDSRAIISGLAPNTIEHAKLHIFLASDTLVKCRVLTPTCRFNGILWTRTEGPSFGCKAPAHARIPSSCGFSRWPAACPIAEELEDKG